MTGAPIDALMQFIKGVVMSQALDRIEAHKRKVLKDLYDQCTKEQRNFFDRMYVSLEIIKETQLNWAIQQCERTIDGNKEKT